MAFWGCYFTFDDVPCEEHQLMMYSFGSTSASAGKFATGVSVVEDKIATRWKPYFYGTRIEDKLNFQLVFGVNPARLDALEYLSRDELETIAAWLTGKDGYRWLYIRQDDMVQVGYRCVVTALEVLEDGLCPYGFKATFECDSPYAYLPEQVFEFEVDGETPVQILNGSTHNGFYYPQMDIEIEPEEGAESQSFTIVNQTDGGRTFSLLSMPTAISTIQVDNDHQIIQFVGENINPYQYFNFRFFRLTNGINDILLSGHGRIRFTCQFPVNVGS